MDIPKAVKDKAKELIDAFGENFDDLGQYQGKRAFRFVFPKDSRTGFPYIYLYSERTKVVEEITGMMAMQILSSIN